jgi:ATP-binding cassette, subfamily B, bacterial
MPIDLVDSANESQYQSLLQQLNPGETLLAWVLTDLDSEVKFGQAILALTDSRLIGRVSPSTSWSSFEISAVRLKLRDPSPVGSLEVTDTNGQLGLWRFTGSCLPSVRKLMREWETLKTGLPPAGTICPSCGAPIPPDEDRCQTCNPEVEPKSIASLFRLLKFAKPRMPMIALTFVLTLLGTAASLIPPYLTMPLLDEVLIPRQNGQDVPFNRVYWFLLGLFGASMIAWLLDWCRAMASSWVSERISVDLRERTFAHLLSLSLEFYGGKRTGDLMSRISSDSDRICNFLAAHLVEFLTDVLMIVLTALILISIDPWLAIVTLLPFPVIVGLVQWARGRFLRGYHQGMIAWGEMVSVLADTIPGIRVVKAFAQESREVSRFNAANAVVLAANDRVNIVWAFFGPVVTFLTSLGLLVVWVFASSRVFNGSITVGVLTAFLAYITRFYSRSESMIRIVSQVQRASASAHRIFEILDRKPSVPEPEKPIFPTQLRGDIELKSVRFRYGTRQVIHGVSLHVKPGEMIGLVGPSGAGKSTLVNLICRFFDVADGSICVDGNDIRSYPVEAYRRNIGMVLQDPFLFYGTIAENIAYGKTIATREEVIAAARAARAHEFILRLPDGYDSLVGERGQSLSGGERQRISIARALLINPKILILDEATSSVDTQTEQEIQAALDTLVQGRTTIAIAHRLSTLRKADRIVVLERGLIQEVGSHDELIMSGGKYSQLHNAQYATTPSN